MNKYSTYSAKKKKKKKVIIWHHQLNGREFEKNSRRWWRTGSRKHGEVLQSTGSQRIGHNLVTEQQENLTSLSNIWVYNWQEYVTKVELRQQIKRQGQNFSYDPHCPSSVHRRTSVCRKTVHNTFRWLWTQITLWIPDGNQQGKRSSQNSVSDSR